MKRTIVKLCTLLAAITLSVNLCWADEETTIYLASLKAQKSPASTGDGQVKLTWLDITGKQMKVDLASQLNYMALGKHASSDGPGVTAQIAGGTLTAIDGMETPMEIGGAGSQIYMTSFVYFHAEGMPLDGSYLADWTFTDPQVTRMTSTSVPPAPVDPMGDGSEERPYRTPCFKVLPDNINSTTYPPTDGGIALATLAAHVGANPYNIYAVFNKYLLGNPVATSANVEATENATANLTVTIEVDGDTASLDAADFDTFTFTNNGNSEWTYDLASALEGKELVSAQKTRITIPVTYTYKNTGYGVKNTTFTVSMVGTSPSTLNVNLSAVALDPNRPEALLFDGTTEQASGTLSEMLATDISGYTNPILRLNKNCGDLEFTGKTFTLDLNGNTAGNITTSSGEVTVAYSNYGGTAGTLNITGGKVILNGGTFSSLTIANGAVVEQNGATVTGAVTNHGTLTTTEGVMTGGLTSYGTLTVNNGTFSGLTAITVANGTATLNRGTITGYTYGLKTTGGTTTVKKLAAITGGTNSVNGVGGTLNIDCGKFGAPLTGTMNFVSGYFKNNTYGVSAEGKTEMLISAGVEYNEGYRYFLGTAETALTNGVGVCRIGTTSYAKLEDAIAYANNNPSVENIVIFMTNNYTLPAGYYTLPANATIVVPMNDTQEKEVNKTAPRVIFNDQRTATPYSTIQPTEFRRLTFASGVNMDVFGNIELTCSQYASNEAYTAQPCGNYGHLVMEEGSHMTLQNGSELRAWGFMTGKGETDARRGATVREMFQMGDWKGAMTSVKIVGMVKKEDNPILYNLVGGDDSDKKIFPVTQYFIQNVESPVKYHPGAMLSTSAAVSEGLLGMSISMAATDIVIVGVDGTHQAIFLMDEMADADNTWVRKWYDAENDIQVYDINSAAHIGSMELNMGDINLLTYGSVPIRLNSAKFDLPLTCNFKIHLLSGSMDFKQNTSLLPGAEVEVDKEATVSITKDDNDSEHTGALYVYDADDWDKYAYCNEVDAEGISHTAYTKTVRYTPSWNGRPTIREEQTKPADAAINVHGTFRTEEGYVYTSAGGANIFSSNEDAGTFIFNQNASDAGSRTVYQVKGVGTYESQTFTSAQLKNTSGVQPAYATTYTNDGDDDNDVKEGDAYCFIDNRWTIMKIDKDNDCFMVDNYGSFYAKPAEYVAVVATKVTHNKGTDDEYSEIIGNDDHTFSDAAGAGRLFILMDDCQWWEVEQKDNLYHCIHPNNDTYYYWGKINNENPDEDPAWHEQKFTITWKNWNGTVIQTVDEFSHLQDTYSVTYGTQAEFLGTNPTREADIDYTYDFTGWNPEPGRVTADVTYTATYEQKPRMYTIIFNNEGGTEIERQFLTHNAVPVCENTPTKVGHTLIWSPAIAAVTGNATYTATWVENPPTEYEVTFFDYNGTTELQKGNVAVGAMPEYTGATPAGKGATSEYTYVFDHWSPAMELVSATSIKSYTAVYREVAVEYSVRFEREDGTEIETNSYRYGETPVCSATPTEPINAQEGYTYSFAWTPQIQTVQGAATYQASFTGVKNKYTVTLLSSIESACALTGAGIYEYGDDATLNATASSGYTFQRWNDGNTDNPRTVNVTDNLTYTAVMQSVAPIENKTITAGMTYDVPADTRVNDLIICSDDTASGSIINAQNLKVDGNAYFDLTLNANAGTWYAVAVPWQVSVANGIYVDGAKKTLNRDYYFVQYNGAIRAAQGKVDDCWQFVNSGNLQPGTFYMIYLRNAATTIRFAKAAYTPVINRQITLQMYPQSTGDDVDANWNGIANPAVFHANMNGLGLASNYDKKAQVFNKSTESLEAVSLSGHTFQVGEPVFIQAETPKSMVLSPETSTPAPARRMAPALESNSEYDIRIAQEDKPYTDRLFISTAEEKADKYVIGQDLAKMGSSAIAAQMWVNRYNAKLCVNRTEMQDNQAVFPLCIFAPKAGEYQISSGTPAAEGEEIYVTLNGNPVWNLAAGAYTAILPAGNSTQYALLVTRQNAPAMPTDIEETATENDAVRKVLIGSQIYILHEGAVYTVTGQKLQ